MPKYPNNPALIIFAMLVLISLPPACQMVPVTPEQEQPVSSEKPAEAEAEPDPLQVLEQQADQAVKEGQVELAIEQYNELLAQNPNAPKIQTKLGLLYLNGKDLEAAKRAFTQAIEQDKNDAVAYNHLAIIQRQQGEFKLALFNYYKAINAQPDYANAHLNLGILLDIYLQDLPKALEQYEIYQQLTGNSSEQVEKWIADLKRRLDSGNEK